MSNIGSWHLAAASNNATPPDGWPEGQAPSTVNNCAREMMSAIRTQWDDAAWFNFYPTTSPSTYISLKAQNKIRISQQSAATTYTATDVYPVGTRLKVVNNNTTKYCTVNSIGAASSSAVFLAVTMDSGTLTSTITSVSRSIISPTNSPIPGGSSGSSGSTTYGGVDNMLLNANFQVAQLGTSFTSATTIPNSDDTYLLDQWMLLSDGNDIVDVTQNTAEAPTGSGFCIALDVETANKKFGIIQFLENKRSIAAIGERVSVSFQAKKGSGNATLETLRAAVISWDSTADSVTSDVVSAWAVAGTNPTLVANWTYENTATNLTLTSAYQTFSIANIYVDTASTANIALFIWCDDADATVGDFAYISDVKLEVGIAVSPFSITPFDRDLAACQRFLSKSFIYATVPVQNAGTATGESAWGANVAGAIADIGSSISFPVIMRTTPTITLYNPAAANAQVRDANANADCTSSSAAYAQGGRSFSASYTANAATVAGNSMNVHWLAEARL